MAIRRLSYNKEPVTSDPANLNCSGTFWFSTSTGKKGCPVTFLNGEFNNSSTC